MEDLYKYKAFYEEFKHNLIMDYCTAGIKAEVIIDTLITPYVCDIVRAGLKNIATTNNNADWDVKGQLSLLSKEFPIPAIKSKSNDSRNAKIDFLLTDDETLYMVELKTSKSSENSDQLDNYLNVMDPDNYLESLFLRILRDNLEVNRYGKWKDADQQYHANKLYGKSPDSAKKVPFSPLTMSGTEKYITTVINLLGKDYKELLDNCAGLKKAKKAKIEQLLNAIKAKFYKFNSYKNGRKSIQLVYLTLYGNDQNRFSELQTFDGQKYTKKIPIIYLRNYEPADKTSMYYQKWEMLQEIFRVLDASVNLDNPSGEETFLNYALKNDRSG